MAKKVDEQTAVMEFDRFCKAVRIKERKLEKLKEEKEKVIELITEGVIIIDNEGAAIYKLDEPICDDSGQELISELKFRTSRIKVDELERSLQGKGTDMEKARNTLGVITGEKSAFLKKMDGDDYTEIMNSVVAFYLPR